jgi:GT2 family glycosyltransferase
MAGPQLLYADGSIQSSRRRFLDPRTAFFESTWLQRFAPHGLIDAFYMREKPDNTICDVDWLYGAAMLVRRSTIEQVGVLDEQSFFMYSEEMDWCKRIKSAPTNPSDAHSPHWTVTYVPQAKVIHLEARSSNQVSAQRAIYFNTSKVRYIRKYFGHWKSECLRLALLSMYLYQTGLESVKWLIGHKRPLRTERIRAYRAVLRSGLR